MPRIDYEDGAAWIMDTACTPSPSIQETRNMPDKPKLSDKATAIAKACLTAPPKPMNTGVRRGQIMPNIRVSIIEEATIGRVCNLHKKTYAAMVRDLFERELIRLDQAINPAKFKEHVDMNTQARNTLRPVK